MRVNCCCCARQIVSYQQNDKYVTSGPVVRMGPDKYCCFECSKDLDENGLFPEEHSA